MLRENKLQGLVLIFEGAGAEFEVEREKQMVVNIKLEAYLVHVPLFHIKGIEVFEA